MAHRDGAPTLLCEDGASLPQGLVHDGWPLGDINRQASSIMRDMPELKSFFLRTSRSIHQLERLQFATHLTAPFQPGVLQELSRDQVRLTKATANFSTS